MYCCVLVDLLLCTSVLVDVLLCTGVLVDALVSVCTGGYCQPGGSPRETTELSVTVPAGCRPAAAGGCRQSIGAG